MTDKNIIYILLILFILVFPESVIYSQINTFIRLNQVGFLPKDIKTAVIISANPIPSKTFSITKVNSNKVIYTGKIEPRKALNNNFRFSYFAEFSALQIPGSYFINTGNTKTRFQIGDILYNSVLDSVLLFFRAQRCGYTDPLFQKVCHPYDATSIIDGRDTIKTQYDITGGWHDAGDYIKFLNTAAFATYTMMFAYEFDSLKFGFDHNNNNVPDILEEAKVGLDWLLRLRYKNKFILQVQDLRDHQQGWRRPDSDLISYDRPGFAGIGKNSIGIYSAVMACAARIWKYKIKYKEFADECLESAIKYYSIRDKVKDLDKIQSGMYQDNKYAGKLALAAVELYQTTHERKYLNEAMEYADSARSDFWWSWGNINAYADYKLAKFNPRFKSYLENSISFLNKTASDKLFNESVGNSWGSNTALLGTALQIILLNDLEHTDSYSDLLYSQRDFIFGRNQWGICFISGIGENFSSHFHSQVAHFNKERLPGAISAGPISDSSFKKYKISFNSDPLVQFQSTEAVYHDNPNDWLTNEPAITTNATGLFVIGFFVNRRLF